jgi:hypothetical protein
MSPALSSRRPLDSSNEIQCDVTARNEARFAFDQMSAVKLIHPLERCRLKLDRMYACLENSQKVLASDLEMTSATE